MAPANSGKGGGPFWGRGVSNTESPGLLASSQQPIANSPYISRMHRLRVLLLALFAMGATEAIAQDVSGAPGPCATPAAIAVTGNSRVTEATIVASAGLRAGDTYGYRDIQRAIELLFGSGQFEDVQINCSLDNNSRATLVVAVRERPLLSGFTFTGINRVAEKDVRERLEQPVGAPLDPGSSRSDCSAWTRCTRRRDITSPRCAWIRQ